MTLRMSRRQYADLYGPTTGDRVRLADTDLFVEVERDLTVPGDEAKFGGGKVLRDGMGQSARATRADGALDLVITNALIVDHTGIVKADIGIRDGRIVGIGKAGNPDIMDGVTPGMVVGAGTEALSAEGKIVTAGAIDAHVHFICPQLCQEAHLRGDHDPRGRRHRARDRHQRDHLHPGPLEPPPHAGSRGGPAREPRLPGQGQRLAARAAPRADRGRRHRPEAPRGLGHDARGHRLRAGGGRRARRPGRDPHRHLERGRLRGGVDRGLQGPDHPHLPHRGRGRRPCARHHPRLRRAQLPPLVDQPDHALHREHPRRAPRHADGLPPPESQDPRGPGLRRVADPGRDHRRGGRAARPRAPSA